MTCQSAAASLIVSRPNERRGLPTPLGVWSDSSLGFLGRPRRLGGLGSLTRAPQFDDLPAFAQPVVVIGEPLQHFRPLGHALAAVVSTPDLVRVEVRELPLNRVGMESVRCIEHGAGGAAETVRGVLIAAVAEGLQGAAQGVFADRARRYADRREKQFEPARQRVKLFEQGKRLARERHDVRSPAFHSLGRDGQHASVAIDLRPSRRPQLAGPEHRQRQQLQRDRGGALAAIAAHGPKQPSKLQRIEDGAIAFRLWSGQRAA